MLIILLIVLIIQAGGFGGIKVGIKADNTEDGWQFISDPGITSLYVGGSNAVTHFIIDENPSHMIIICAYGHFRESFDRGKTWSNIPLSKFGQSENSSMRTKDIYYVNGTWYFDGPSISQHDSPSIYKTKDFTTFEEICPDAGCFWTDGLVFYKGGAGSGPGRNDKCFFVSKDGGVNWENLSSGIQQALQDYKYYIGVKEIIVFKGKIFVLINDFFWLYSLDNGTTFQKLSDDPYLYQVDERLWIVEYCNDKTIIKESQDGLNWQVLTDKAPIKMSINRSFPDDILNDIIWDPISRIFIMASNNNVFYSNNGKSWIPNSAGLDIQASSNYSGYNCFALSSDRIYLVFNGKLYAKNLPLTIKKHVVLRINDQQIIANGKEIIMEILPVIKNNRTFLPIRYISEPLGAEVNWDAKTKKVTVSLDGITIELWIGKNIAKVNGIDTPIDQNSKVVPYIDGGRTMLPLRFISENLGSAVYWDQILRLVTIVYPKGE